MLDPMLATGGSAKAAIRGDDYYSLDMMHAVVMMLSTDRSIDIPTDNTLSVLLERGALERDILFLNVVSCPEGG